MTSLTKRTGLSVRALQTKPLVMRWRDRRAMAHWVRDGYTGPPPHRAKVDIILAYASAASISTMVETGTYLGQTVDSVKTNFDRVISIELDPELHRRAERLFRESPHVTLLQGDSGVRLRDAVALVSQPCLFWLDAHYSGGVTARADRDTPIEAELRTILDRGEPNDIVLIDDARDFVGNNGYPTVGEIRALVTAGRPSWTVYEDRGIIRIHSVDLSAPIPNPPA